MHHLINCLYIFFNSNTLVEVVGTYIPRINAFTVIKTAIMKYMYYYRDKTLRYYWLLRKDMIMWQMY